MSWTHDNNGISSVPLPTLSSCSLKATASWIRDDLDAIIARDGPNELHPDDVLTLHSVLIALQQNPISLHTLRFSRIYLAVREIAGKATRWPGKLVDEADRVIEHLESRMGPLRGVRTPLYEEGGRLHGICEAQDTTREALLKRFSGTRTKGKNHMYQHGALAFKAGDWWINGLFAFRDGIIDLKSVDGGIAVNKKGAYAIVLSDSDEKDSPDPSRFTYQCKTGDKGRVKLTAADFSSRYPLRVLRSHTLTSQWAPRAGLRYDGLFVSFRVYLSNSCSHPYRYRVAGWSIKPCGPQENDGYSVKFDIHFKAEKPWSLLSSAQRISWNRILLRPTAEEVDDYKMYKILNQEHREKQRRSLMPVVPPLEELTKDIDSQIVASEDPTKSDDQLSNSEIEQIKACEPFTFDSASLRAQIPIDMDSRTDMDGSSDKAMSPGFNVHDHHRNDHSAVLGSFPDDPIYTRTSYTSFPSATSESLSTSRRARQRAFDGSGDAASDSPTSPPGIHSSRATTSPSNTTVRPNDRDAGSLPRYRILPSLSFPDKPASDLPEDTSEPRRHPQPAFDTDGEVSTTRSMSSTRSSLKSTLLHPGGCGFGRAPLGCGRNGALTCAMPLWTDTLTPARGEQHGELEHIDGENGRD